ncbi:hypothetical protein N7448_003722 [Penicillium atrosanguineum]|uniref:Altered inheritance of mitochondria protein 11 n=1 Tax=Penicillium atrosanguineum TaxID=1132637 RepID=A0A9W9PWH0_9EURO|nr:uncharacterized protein N7443_002691 [Penicillium atrosanguineum]KAJ5122588.1 hypothetical protein N7526_009525 [Penicillium atrosanguineum]KAJ5140314.1 hypothetical protein N7448_003722 [Penicillium atrosanguineum]KAJ5310230.1 hypothetical protein N7443_002691 [Penicillium atrosanguineum]KAJ5315746.1 hypothetical protein N7476_006053 [Penicillium atrosanguineum]
MSESFAVLRRRRSDELAKLADEHMQHDLQADDRDKLKAAASKVSLWTTVGSAVGISLGLYAAIRLRSTRKAFFTAVRAQERPTKVVFADGRTEAIPDLTPLLKPTTLGDFATYFFASAGGLFLGGELGFLAGSASAASNITSDPESRKRIETAFRKFRADVLRKEADALDKGDKMEDMMF